MIELYEGREQSGQHIDDVLDQAERLARSGKTQEALKMCVTGLTHAHAQYDSYTRGVLLALELFLEAKQPRAAMSLAWYQGSARMRKLMDHVPRVDRARTLQLLADKEPDLYTEASALFEREGLLARAAICHERALSFEKARTLWSRLADQLEHSGQEHYAAGLARFNVSRTSRELGDDRTARSAMITAVHRLEEAATVFEGIGQRERAFDCYSVLIAIGDLSGTFEHVLVGSLDSIRILREDNLRHHVVRAYEELLERAEQAEEFAAAATLARELASYAEKHRFSLIQRQAVQTQASAWERSAAKLEAHGAPPGLIENALLAAVRCRAEFSDHAEAAQTFERLADLTKDDARKEQYRRAAERSRNAPGPKKAARPADAHKAVTVNVPNVWHVDLLEWENLGSASEACADVLLDPGLHADRITTRTALMARLVALAAEHEQAQDARRANTVLSDYLSRIGLYAILAPLEKLAAHSDSHVRRAAINALSRYFFKRSFVTVETALDDPDAEVRNEALVTLGRLRFDHAFEPLCRIYRSATQPAAKLAALAALSRLETAEAAELALNVVEHGTDAEYAAIRQALSSSPNRRLRTLAEQVLPNANPEFAKRLEAFLKVS